MPEADRLFNERPLVRAALGFCAGILIGGSDWGAWAYLVLSLFCFAACLLLKPPRRPLIFLLFLLMGLVRSRLGFSIEDLPTPALVAAVRDRFAGAAEALFGENAPLIRAMVLGDRAALDALDYALFRDAGLAHVLALSGLHISYFVAAISFMIPRRFPRLRFLFTSLFLWFYCALSGFPASLMRAGLLWFCSFLSSLAGMRRDLPSALALAAIVILLLAPGALFEAGFQLSFAAVIGIILLERPLEKLLHKLPAALAGSMAMTFSATLATLPIGAWHFGSVQTLSLLSNLLLLPFVPFLLIPGFLALLLYPSSLARIPAFFAMQTADLFRGVSAVIAGLPFAVLPFRPNLLFCALYFFILFLLSPYALRSFREKRIPLTLLLACLLLSVV